MPLLFISHSSKDKAEAEQLLQWLEDQGFEALFLDSDTRHGIKAGNDWEKTLYREIHRSHAFIFLLSDHWTASQWCNFEFMQARALGKAIFPLRIQTGLDTTIAADIQHLDLSKDRNDALQRLHAELTELSLNTGQHTVWDRSRSPYPGMMAFEAEDAPVFFGRDDEIRCLRERLDQHRIQGSAALLVLLAASGAGKSSVIRAGLLPRLRHDKRHWLVTEAMRPEREPLRKLAQVLAVAAGQAGNAEDLFTGLQGEQALTVLSDTLHQIRAQHQQMDSTLLLSIDQAEELFTTAKPEQTRQLLELLAAAEAEHLPIQTLLAMRSEYLETLQALLAQQVGGMRLSHDLLTLDTLPLERISQLIRGPAKVAGLSVEDGLLSAATQDAATTDALPLLAFALRELYEQFGADGDLTLAEYQQLGSDQLNPLENVVQDKAAQAIRPQQLSEAELKALREAFIPQMVRVNESGDYVRQAANWQDLPAAAHPLLDKLTNARLLVKRDGQVEVSHEALLRHWDLLNGWLREEHDFLLGKQQLEVSLHDWQQLAEEQRDKGLLRGIALERAREWLFADKAGLNAEEKEFILQSLKQNEFEQQRIELAFGEANKLINYINFDLRDQLEPIAPLNITRALRERVEVYYRNLAEYVDNDEFLHEHAVNLSQQADGLVAQGKLPEAESLYREARQFMQQRADSDPENTGWQRDLSVSLNKIGDILSAQGKLDEAKAVFEQDLAIAQTLAENDPSNAGWQRDLSVSLERIGKIQEDQGNLDGAIVSYQKSLAIMEPLAESDPSNAGWQRHISVTYNLIGDILSAQGKLDEAKAVFEKSQIIFQTLAENAPSNAGWQHDLSASYSKIGDILSAQGKLDEAKAVFEKSQNIFQTLAENDPSNAGWQRDLSVSLEKIADIYLQQENLDEAAELFQQQLTIIEKLMLADPSNVGWQTTSIYPLSRMLSIEAQQGNIANARKHGEKALSILKPLAEQGLLHGQQQQWIGIVEGMIVQLN